MKKLFTLLALSISLTTFANTVIVKGYVRDANNKGVPNRYIKIYADSSANTNCLIGHYKITNGEGFYIDTVSCTGTDIKKLLVSTESCSTILTNTLQITGSVAESNFTICLPPQSQLHQRQP